MSDLTTTEAGRRLAVALREQHEADVATTEDLVMGPLVADCVCDDSATVCVCQPGWDDPFPRA